MVWAPISYATYISAAEYFPSFLTDHRYMQVTFSLPLGGARGPGFWKFNTQTLKDPDYCTLVQSFWSFWQTKADSTDFSTPLEWWDMGKIHLREITRSYCQSIALSRSATKRELTRRFSLLRRLCDSGDDSVFAELCAVQEELRAFELREAQAAQVRSRCQWVEEGEVSSSYFFSLEIKHRSKKSMSAIRDPVSGVTHYDPLEILRVWRDYYATLFTADACDSAVQTLLLSQLERALSLEDRDRCEGPLSLEECDVAVRGMATGKTPGSDGFPAEFFVHFWNILGVDLVDILNFSYEHGRLSISQRRGLIINLFKKGERLVTKNWRPISLLNADYKIATRAIAGRLLQVIASVLSPDQTCGVPGRTISENLSVLRDVIDYAAAEDLPVAFLSLDQEKAFDRVDWTFLSRTLEAMGFGPSFRQWISIFYTDIESAVVVNGWMSPFFQPSRGVRQGCPLSPLLYVLCAEVLACGLRAAPSISGITLPGATQELRCSAYADDTSVLVTTDASIDAVFSVYSLYERGSGAKLNRSKSKGLWLGSWKDRTDTPQGLDWVRSLPVLGAVLSASSYDQATWEPRITKVEKRLSAWKGRHLSYQGRSLIINALALSQIWHLCAVFVMPKWAEVRLDKAIWSFFWGGKRDLVARRTVTRSTPSGGFGVVDFRVKANALRLQWFRRFLTDSTAKWKDFFQLLLLSPFRLGFVELLTPGTRRRCRHGRLTLFYKRLLAAWRTFDGGLCGRDLALGVSRDAPLLVPTMTTRSTYLLGLTMHAQPPHCVDKFRPVYGELDWSHTWGQLHAIKLDRVVIDLNWKIAHGVLYTASRLAHSFGYRNVDPLCFCTLADETLEHLFFHCSFAQLVLNWVYFQLLRAVPGATPFTLPEILFGFTGARRRCIPPVIMWMLLVVKHRIWVARCDFRFRNVVPNEAKCLKTASARIKFLLRVEAGKHTTALQRGKFEQDWLAGGSLGYFSQEKLVFSF